MPDFTQGLNESQKKAVLHNENPLLVLAGAGSGKTRVLTTRIARLVYEKRCKPEQILAVTFTNKAAREMKDRVATLTSTKIADAMTLCTFHSLGVKILREDGEKIGFTKSFSIIDEHEKISTLKSIRAAGVRGLKDRDHRSLHIESVWPKTAHSIRTVKKEDPDQRKLSRVYSSYSAILQKRQTVDFDDLLLLPLQLFLKYLRCSPNIRTVTATFP